MFLYTKHYQNRADTISDLTNFLLAEHFNHLSNMKRKQVKNI